MTGLLHAAPLLSVSGIPLPYSIDRDSTVILIMLCCFFATAIILARCGKILAQNLKDFFRTRVRGRSSLFNVSTSSEIKYLFLLTIQVCILTGVYGYTILYAASPQTATVWPSVVWIGIYTLCSMTYLVVKWMLYAILGWVFFDKRKVAAWNESYSTLLHATGLLLLPLSLLAIYLDMSLDTTMAVGLFLVIVLKISILIKWIKLFCESLYGGVLIFVYFCAVEIIPLFIAVVGIIQLSRIVVF